MKKAALILAVLVLAVTSPAQQRAGTITGRIVDNQGKPLPNVTVTLSGPSIGSMKTVTNETGIFRYPAIYPGREYSVKAERIDFKTANRTNIIVMIGENTPVNLTLEPGKIEEQVTATAVIPNSTTRTTATLAATDPDRPAIKPLIRWCMARFPAWVPLLARHGGFGGEHLGIGQPRD